MSQSEELKQQFERQVTTHVSHPSVQKHFLDMFTQAISSAKEEERSRVEKKILKRVTEIEEKDWTGSQTESCPLCGNKYTLLPALVIHLSKYHNIDIARLATIELVRQTRKIIGG